MNRTSFSFASVKKRRHDKYVYADISEIIFWLQYVSLHFIKYSIVGRLSQEKIVYMHIWIYQRVLLGMTPDQIGISVKSSFQCCHTEVEKIKNP